MGCRRRQLCVAWEGGGGICVEGFPSGVNFCLVQSRCVISRNDSSALAYLNPPLSQGGYQLPLAANYSAKKVGDIGIFLGPVQKCYKLVLSVFQFRKAKHIGDILACLKEINY